MLSPPTPAPSPNPRDRSWAGFNFEAELQGEVDEDAEMRSEPGEDWKGKARADAPSTTSELRRLVCNLPCLQFPAPTDLIDSFKTLAPSQRYAFLAALVNNLALPEALVLSRNIEPKLRRDFLKELPIELALYVLSFVSGTGCLWT